MCVQSCVVQYMMSLSLHSLFLFDSSFQVTVPIVSNEKCKDMFLKAGRQEYIPDIFMCAGFEEGGRDSCQVLQNLQTLFNPQYSFKSLDPSMSKHDQILKLPLLYRAIRAVHYKSVARTADISWLASSAGASDVLKPICLAFARGYPSSPVGSWKT